MRVLALDIGEVRVGVAVSDPAGRVASPVCVLPAQEVLAHAVTFRRVLGPPGGARAGAGRAGRGGMRSSAGV